MSEGILTNTISYLIGSIDCAKDAGTGWRKEIRQKCKDRGIQAALQDPTDKIEGLIQEVKDDQVLMNTLKSEGRFDELSVKMKQIIRTDLRCVDISDFIIMYIDPDTFMFGSVHEYVLTINQKKPILVIVKGGKYRAPNWLFGTMDHNYIYDSIDEAVDVLDRINRGVEPLSDKWVFLRKQVAQLIVSHK